MNGVNLIDREAAATYASWFRSLGDRDAGADSQPARAQREPMRRRRDRRRRRRWPKSTVSQHLKVLAEVGFVLVELVARRAGTASTRTASRASRAPPTS